MPVATPRDTDHPTPIEDTVPDGYVRVPLDKPPTRVLAQVAALSQGRDCTATATTIATYLGVTRQHVQDQLAALDTDGRTLSTDAGRRRLRRLTPVARYAPRFAIIPKRAIAGVGTDPRRGTTRRNGDTLLWLYCEIRRANTTTERLTRSKLAATLGVPEATLPRLLRTLREDGWVRQDPRSGWVAHTNPLTVVPTPDHNHDHGDRQGADERDQGAGEQGGATVPDVVPVTGPVEVEGGCSTATGGVAVRRHRYRA